MAEAQIAPEEHRRKVDALLKSHEQFDARARRPHPQVMKDLNATIDRLIQAECRIMGLPAR